jgi:hypothetical protein
MRSMPGVIHLSRDTSWTILLPKDRTYARRPLRRKAALAISEFEAALQDLASEMTNAKKENACVTARALMRIVVRVIIEME